MNPLTQIKNTQKATRKEWAAGLSESASWHARFKHSAYVFAGGLDYELTEGDLLAVFAQYGEIVDANLVRDRDTGKSRGFAFLAYENQSSTVLAVDNLSGAKVAGRTIRVEHVDDYKRKVKEVGGEVEEAEGEDAHKEGKESLPTTHSIDDPRWRKAGESGAAVGRDRNAAEPPREAPGSVMDLMKEHLRKKNKEIVEKAEQDSKNKKKSRRDQDGKEQGRNKGDAHRRRSRSLSPTAKSPTSGRKRSRRDGDRGDRRDHSRDRSREHRRGRTSRRSESMSRSPRRDRRSRR